MIYAWYEGVRYGIQFSYERDRYGYREDTFCDIYALGSDLENMPPLTDDNLMGSGEAFLHDDDNFCAETGRKIALTRALESAGDFEPVLNSKEFRSKIWTAYHLRNNRLSDMRDEANRVYDINCQ